MSTTKKSITSSSNQTINPSTAKENTAMSTSTNTTTTAANAAPTIATPAAAATTAPVGDVAAAANAIPPVPVVPEAALQPAPAPQPPSAPAAPAYIQTPPAVNIPPVPPGFQPTTGAKYRGLRPTKAELVSLPDAVDEIRNYSAWNMKMGAGGYPQDQAVEALDAGNQWSNVRNTASNWDAYCRDKEGTVWEVIRGMLTTMGPAFRMAAAADNTLLAQFPNLAAFLNVKNKSAKQAVATKKANKAAVAAGLPAYHGAVGKRRQKRDEKAAAAATTTPAQGTQSADAQPTAHGGVAVTSGTASSGASTNGASPANGAAAHS